MALPAKNTCDVYCFSLCFDPATGEQPASMGPTSHVRSFQRVQQFHSFFLASCHPAWHSCFRPLREGKSYGRCRRLCRAQSSPVLYELRGEREAPGSQLLSPRASSHLCPSAATLGSKLVKDRLLRASKL